MRADKNKRKEFYQGYRLTTNNRMELMGVIFGLQQIKIKSNVNVYTDSRYVIDGINLGWAKKWKSNNWYRTKNEKAANYDLWEKLLNLLSKHTVEFHWVKGHSGHTENERCDQLANIAINSQNLLEDKGFDNDLGNSTKLITKTLSKSKNTIEKEGDTCRKCKSRVVKKYPKKRKLKPNQSYYFEYYLFCTECKTMYMIEEAKRKITNLD